MIPGSGRSPGGGHGKPLQYSCLENPHAQRSLSGYSPWGCKESDTTEVTEHERILVFAKTSIFVFAKTSIFHDAGYQFIFVYLISEYVYAYEA